MSGLLRKEQQGAGGKEQGGPPKHVQIPPGLPQKGETNFLENEKGDSQGYPPVPDRVNGRHPKSLSQGEPLGSLATKARSPEYRQKHEPGSMSSGHEECPEDQVPETDAHPNPARMPGPQKPIEPKPRQENGSTPGDPVPRKPDPGRPKEHDGGAHGKTVADDQGADGLNDRSLAALLITERHGKQPAHGRIQTMKGTQPQCHGPGK